MADKPIERFGFLIHDAARLMRRRFEARGHELGLSAAQWRAMVWLVRQGPMTQAKLAEILEIEPISVSRLIDRMELGGWAMRKADPNDRRTRMVEATEMAKTAFAGVKAMAGSVFEDAMAGLSETQRSQLMDALEIVIENLSKPEADTGADITRETAAS